MRARSIAASVCPARFSTPPSRASSGKMWPGRSRSRGRVAGSTSARTVAARSWAEMPVVVSWRKATLTVKALRIVSVLLATISGRSSSRARSRVTGAQMTPEVWWRKKAIFSGVANSAAMMRSPSFSRSSSSTTPTISPRPTAVIASSTLAKPTLDILPGKQPLDVLHGHVHLEVHPVAGLLGAERRHCGGVGDDGDREPVVEHVDDREAHAVDGDRALLDDVAQQLARHPDPQVRGVIDDLAHAG